MIDEVELNQARVAEVEVPIFILEQKVERLEQMFESWNIAMTEKLTGSVC